MGPSRAQTHTGGGAGSWRARSPCTHGKESSGASLGGPTVAGSSVLCLLPETLLQTQIHFLSIKKGVKLRGFILFYSRTMQYLRETKIASHGRHKYQFQLQINTSTQHWQRRAAVQVRVLSICCTQTLTQLPGRRTAGPATLPANTQTQHLLKLHFSGAAFMLIF